MSLRVVIDTNVRISSLISPQGACARLMTSIHEDGHVQLISESMLGELKGKLTSKFRWPVSHLAPVLDSVLATTIPVNSAIAIEACRDPDDNRVLECALAGRATHIITGDHDLLTLHPWNGIQIVTVRQFLDQYPARPNPRTIENE